MDKNSNPVISVIIPVYNTGLYLEECLDSIVKQNFKDFEVICIDDGSSDNSLEILKNYEERYDNFKILAQPNMGVSHARNKGLQHAKGEYIAFLDSDDFIKPNYLEVLYNNANLNNSQIVMCNYYRYFDSNKSSLPIVFTKGRGNYSNMDILKSIIPDNLLHSYLWNKLWHRDLFDNLDFPIMKFEDIAIMCKLIYKANKITIVSDKLYYYRIRKTSIVRNYSISTQNDYIKAYGLTREFLEKEDLYSKLSFSFKLLSIKVMAVMFFVNIFLHKEYGSFKLVLLNMKRSYKFIRDCNKPHMDFKEKDLLNKVIIKDTD